MSWFRGAIIALAVIASAPSVLAQGIPGTRAFVEAQKGWDAIRDGRHQDAAEAFALALDAEPRDPANHFGSGLAAYLLGQPTVAQHELERALELAPSLTDASLVLGNVLYRASDIEGAIRVYEAAMAFAPANDALRTRLDELRQEALVHGNFLESHGAHFTVLFEGAADAELASRVIDILEAAYWRVSTALAIYPERTITVQRHHAVTPVGGGGVRRTYPTPGRRRRRQSQRTGACHRPRVYPRAGADAYATWCAHVAARRTRRHV
jgi:tetratricopeptide (TPR) repeat protein